MHALSSAPTAVSGRRPCQARLAGGGFTLVELMITLAIVAVLAAVALPAYFNYVKRAAYAELLAQAAPVKTALHTCLSIEQDNTRCNDLAKLGIDPPSATTVFNSLRLNPDTLTITLVPNDYRGIEATDTCDLVPVIRRVPRQGGGSGDPELVGWAYEPSAPCVTKGYVKS